MMFRFSLARPMSAFAIAASLSGCGSLPDVVFPETSAGKYAPVVPSSPSPSKKVNGTELAGKISMAPAVDDMSDLHDEPEDEGVSLPTYSTDYIPLYCAQIPKDDFTYVTGQWESDCRSVYTESGNFLIEQLLEKEYKKRVNQAEPSFSFPDPDPFPFRA